MKKSVIVFLSLFLFISAPFHANANIVTTTGKYLINAVKHVPGGAKVNATNTVTGAKHVVTHGVSAPALGTAIGAGIVGGLVSGGLGLAFQGITGLAFDAVDWVMDEANNQIKWKKKGADNGTGVTPNTKQYYQIIDGSTITKCYPASNCIPALKAADPGNKYTHCVEYPYPDMYASCYYPYGSGENRTYIYRVANPDYVPGGSGANEYKSIPLVDLAKKILDLADSGNAACQSDVEDYVTNLAKDGKLDNELDNATDITKPDEPTKPDDKDKDCPIGTTKEGEVCIKPAPDGGGIFCNKSDFTRKVCDWIDWTQVKHDEPAPDAGNVDTIDKSEGLNIDENRINFADQCPAPQPINITVVGFGYTEELSYQPMCDFFGMLKPFIVGMGGVSSTLMIAGAVRRG